MFFSSYSFHSFSHSPRLRFHVRPLDVLDVPRQVEGQRQPAIVESDIFLNFKRGFQLKILNSRSTHQVCVSVLKCTENSFKYFFKMTKILNLLNQFFSLLSTFDRSLLHKSLMIYFRKKYKIHFEEKDQTYLTCPLN